MPRNLDPETVAGFGAEWSAFDQSGLSEADARGMFEQYFSIFPWDSIGPAAEGFDLGCGTGRWARLVAPRVGILHCIDASPEALRVAERNLHDAANVRLHLASVDSVALAAGSMDFGYSLGVLHHVPDTALALADCARMLKPGAPFLVYLYYRFDNQPAWYRALWGASDAMRRIVSRFPFALRLAVANALALLVYWPLARAARLLEGLGLRVHSFPLAWYRHRSFYTMRTDALDRFGTRLEQRFTAAEIEGMLTAAGFEGIRFRPEAPFWCAMGRRAGLAA